jgi:hypothetical protein
VSKVRSLTELCGLRVSVESYVAPKGPLQCKSGQRFGHTQQNCGYAPRCAACGGRWLLYSAGKAPLLWMQGKPHGELPGLCEVERSEGRTCKAGARSWPKEGRHSPSHRSERAARRALCRADGPGRGVESRCSRGGVLKATTPSTPIPNHLSQPVTEASEKPKVTAARKTARPQKSEPKTTAALKLAVGSLKRKQP